MNYSSSADVQLLQAPKELIEKNKNI